MRMTDMGIERFSAFIDSLRTDDPQDFPKDILQVGDYAQKLGGDILWLDNLNLDDRLATARALNEIVEKIGLSSAERDTGFWVWCSAYLFDRLCKRSKGGRFAPGEIAIWVPQPDNWRRYYRHYLASIWRVYLAHRNNEKELIGLLNGPVNIPGELWAQLAAYQLLITNASMIDVVYCLYWDKEKNIRKPGSGGNSPRRLVQVLKQFERTWDFFAMSGEQIVALLPREFDRFKEVQ